MKVHVVGFDGAATDPLELLSQEKYKELDNG